MGEDDNEEIRLELADAYEQLAAQGLLLQELESLRRHQQQLETEHAILRGIGGTSERRVSPSSGPANGIAGKGRLLYARLQDGRQVELTNKVLQQEAEIVELQERLQQLLAMRGYPSGSIEGASMTVDAEN